MQASQVPEPLREKLGSEATAGLLDLFETARLEWGEEVLRLSSEGFERRLSDECAEIRVEMAHLQAGLRQEMQEMRAGLRQEMHQLAAGLRQELYAMGSGLQKETHAMGAALQKEIADQRFEILKWAFLFWIGQFFAVASLIAVLIRFLQPPA